MTNQSVMLPIEGLLQIDSLVPWFDELGQAFLITLELFVVALVIGFCFGLLLAITRQYTGPILSRVATGYIEVIRGTPLLTQLFLIYAIPPAINVFLVAQGSAPMPLDWYFSIIDSQGRTFVIMNWPIVASILGLGLNSAAYQAEYFRGAILSISAGQLAAAHSIGMSRGQGIRYIVLPQMLRRVIPSWSNEAAYLPKYTVAAGFIGVSELFQMSKVVVSRTFLTLPVYIVAASIFLVLITIISKALDVVHDKKGIPGL